MLNFAPLGGSLRAIALAKVDYPKREPWHQRFQRGLCRSLGESALGFAISEFFCSV